MDGIDRSVLKTFKNPCRNHTHILDSDELTFDGFPTQPDFAHITIECIPAMLVIELQSVKKYLHQYRNKHISYERILNTIFEDFWYTYQPNYLKVKIKTNPRGGISSTLFLERRRTG